MLIRDHFPSRSVGLITQSRFRAVLLALGVGAWGGLSVLSPSSAATIEKKADLTQRLDALMETPPFDHAFVGACVVSLQTGQTWYLHNADRRFSLASNTKLFTGAAALEVLEPTQTFETRVLFRPSREDSSSIFEKAEPDHGILHGDLVLEGGGDPSLTADDLDDLAHAIAARGIRQIDGDLLTDATRFTGPGRGPDWGWDWEGDYYAAPASALTVNLGRVEVTVTPGDKPGQSSAVSFSPPSASLIAENRAVTGASSVKTAVHIARRHASPIVDVSGVIPSKGKPYSDEIAVDDPEELAGRVFRAALERAGVEVRDELHPLSASSRVNRRKTSETVVAEHRSEPLSVLLRKMDLPSDNHYAEILLRQVGIAWKKDHGTTPAGATANDGDSEDNSAPAADTADDGLAAERALLKRWGISQEEAHTVDGSGLSRRDQATPQAMVQLLQTMWKGPHRELYFHSLPLAGRTGTLRRRMIGTPGEANVRAKTGSLTGVSCLSGLLTTRTGEPLAFSILMNNFSGSTADARALQDRICAALADSP